METTYFSQALDRLNSDEHLLNEGEDLLKTHELESHIEALLSDTRRANELRLTMVFLLAIIHDRVSLNSIEELSRIKTYKEQLEDLELLIKEQAATFQVYILMHRIGEVLTPALHRAEKAIWTKEAQELLASLAEHYRLEPHDVMHLTEIIAWQRFPHRAFVASRPAGIGTLIQYANRQGLDSEMFINMLQVSTLLSSCISKNPSVFVNFLMSEHDYDTSRRDARMHRRQSAKKKREQEIFRDVGIDGNSIFHLLNTKPSKEAGQLIQTLQKAARGNAELPKLPNAQKSEILSRVQEAARRLNEEDL